MTERVGKYVGVEAVALTIAIFALSLYFLWYRRYKWNYPPGPKGLPVIGCVTQLGDHPANTLTALSKKFGGVFSIQIGLRNWVILNDQDCIKQALLRKDDDFSGRPNLRLLQKMSQGIGTIFRDFGPEWKIQKKFIAKTLRKFGVGEKRLEDLVLDEANHLTDEIQTKSEIALDTQKLFTKAAGNIVLELVLGSRLSYDNKTYCDLIACLDTTFFDASTMPAMLALLVAPIMRYTPSLRKVYGKFCRDLDTTFGILSGLIEKQKKHFDECDVRCLADAYLKQMKSAAKKNPVFKEMELFQVFRELFVAGSVNVSSVVLWCLLCFLNYPEHQDKIYEEIVNVIGESGTPSMKCKDEMPFTCAFILEIMRHRTFVPFGMPHSTTVDATLNGYEIPKNTPVLANWWAVHHDPKLFKEPEEFRPERFLNEQGKYVHDYHVAPFSIGPRYCVGDQMSKTEIFLFLVAIVQKFKIASDPKKPPADFNNGIHGIVYTPYAFDAVFEKR